MKAWGVVLVLSGLVALWTGLGGMNRSHVEQITYRGASEIVHCDGDEPTSGPLLSIEARRACEDGWADAQSTRPVWIGGGAALSVAGVVILRRRSR